MTRRTAAVLAWGAWGVFALLAVSAVLLSVIVSRGGPAPTEVFSAREVLGTTIFMGAFLATSTVGGLIASREPDNAIGWMMLAVAVSAAILFAGQQYATVALEVRPGSLPGARWAVWISNWIWIFPIAVPLTLLMLLFPDGRLPTPRWRPFAWFAGGFLAFAAIVFALSGGNLAGIRVEDPVGIETLQPVALFLDGPGFLVFVLLMVVSTVALVRRYRSAGGDERQQIKWFMWAAALAVTIFLAQAALDALGLRGTLLGAVLPALSFLLIPVGIGIAILRHRLYDIDLVINKTVVYGALAAIVTGVYVGVVVGIGAIVGSRGNLFLSILATAVIAVAFQPLRERVRHLANRLVYGKRATPYEVLSRASERLAAGFALEEVLPELARLTAQATGAERSGIWLHRGGEWQEAAASPATDLRSLRQVGDTLTLENERSFAVRHREETLGAITVAMPRKEDLTPAQEQLLDDLASQAGLVLRNVSLLEELRASRQRIVAAQDEERRRLERNIHDGAQQQLVALAVRLKLAETVARKKAPDVAALLEGIRSDTTEALENLRDLARGIYPPLLADQGLAAALTAQARKVPFRVDVQPNGVARYPQEVEAAVYFCVLEALQNAAKYAEASRAVVSLRTEDGDLVFAVDDDGRGFDLRGTATGAGLTNMRDRVEALGGTLVVDSELNRGTTVAGRIPVQERKTAG